MIIVRSQYAISEEDAEKIKTTLKQYFKGEDVLVLNQGIEIQFVDRDGKRCAYCGTLGASTDKTCSACGAVLTGASHD